MKVRTLSVLLIMIAIYFITAVAAEVFVDDFVRPHSLFAYLLASTLVASAITMTIGFD